MSDKLVIAVIEGTSRAKRESIKASRFVHEIGQGFPGLELIFVDPRDFTFTGDGNDPEGKDPRYSDITKRADGFFIVTPEYNHSYPGSLKRMLDSEYEHYFRKPVALAGVSNSAWGGTRAVESLLPSLRGMGLVVTPYATYFPRIQDIFAEDGTMHPEFVEKYTNNIRYQWEELLWFASALKAGRESV